MQVDANGEPCTQATARSISDWMRSGVFPQRIDGPTTAVIPTKQSDAAKSPEAPAAFAPAVKPGDVKANAATAPKGSEVRCLGHSSTLLLLVMMQLAAASKSRNAPYVLMQNYSTELTCWCLGTAGDAFQRQACSSGV